MGEKVIIGPIDKGLTNFRTAFNIDNDAFPTLINAYQWRGRIKRKRGSSPLVRLTKYFDSTIPSYGSITTVALVAGAANLLSGFALDVGGNIYPGSISFVSGANTYTDPAMTGILIGAPGGSGTINYATGDVTVVGGGANINTATFRYYPSLPVMAVDDEILEGDNFPTNLAFDSRYSYQITNTTPYTSYNVSFYKNPASIGTYVHKTNETPLHWNGQNYQKFWTVNYQGGIFATNGITVPYSDANIGMQFKPILTVDNITGGPPANADLTITGHGLVVGDFVFINEVATTTGINFQTGYVTTVVNANKVTVTFPSATIAANGAGGIAQYLTNNSNVLQDCLRYYDGDPTNGNATTPALTGTNGWVNFCPPMSQFSASIGGLPAAQYYLVSARIIVPYKDRLLFFGPVVQSSTGNPIYLKDTVVFSENGTVYYTASFTGDPVSAATVFTPSYLVPENQTAVASSFFTDQVGFGGFIQAGIDQAINSAYQTRDVIVVGFDSQQSRLIYTGQDVLPFVFYTINSEYGSNSVFSGIPMDEGVVSVGPKGYIQTNEQQCARIDLAIPDQVFQINLKNNGTERMCAQRDFINEWIYFTYPGNQSSSIFPNQTLQFNYRDNSWAIFDESFTCYGSFRPSTVSFTWGNIGNHYPTWNEWNVPWNAGATTLFQPQVVAGNQQGYIFIRDQGTTEPKSLNVNFYFSATITNATQANPCVLTANNNYVLGQNVKISGVTGMTQLNGNTYLITAVSPTTITIDVDSTLFTAYGAGGVATPLQNFYSANHGMNDDDFFLLTDCTGTMSTFNGNIYQVSNATTNTFATDIIPTGTYYGLGQITRLYRPTIKTKQFPMAWGMARKTRIGSQQYLFTTTPKGQVTVLIFLSQNDDFPYNINNDATIYSTLVYTCPESTNLGLTPANVNLNLVTAIQQQQTWHRMNTSLLGDTVQLGITLSDDQMMDTNLDIQFSEIELHSIILDVNPSMLLV